MCPVAVDDNQAVVSGGDDVAVRQLQKAPDVGAGKLDAWQPVEGARLYRVGKSGLIGEEALGCRGGRCG